jgi:glucose/mannose-6-phosphate isomerase
MEFLEELRFLKEQLGFRETIKDTDYEQVVIAGMGSSGIAGRIFQELYTKKPVFLIDDYRIPEFVNSKTLFIAISYSGNTEETLTAAAAARERGARIATISSGGKMCKLGDENVLIPRADFQPRAAMGYLLMPLLLSFKVSTEEDLKRAYALLSELDDDNEECKRHADAIWKAKSIPLVFAASPFRGVAYRWKAQFNENAKVMSYANYFPELSHNETMALAGTYKKDMFYFFVLGSEYANIRRRIELTEGLTDTSFHDVALKGRSLTEKVFYLIHYGDYVSYHLGKQKGEDPADWHIVEDLKKKLAEKPQ